MAQRLKRRSFLGQAAAAVVTAPLAAAPFTTVGALAQALPFRSNGGLTLWAGTVRNKGYVDRLQAARIGGFTRMSLSPLDLKRFGAQGLRVADLRSRAADAGVALTVLDPLTRWLPKWEQPATFPADAQAFHAHSEDEFFRMAEALGAASGTVFEPFGTRHPTDQAAESFARVCDRAAGLGMRIHLEFMPFTGIRTLRESWDIVRTANRGNGGLVMDYWHFYRGEPDMALLASIPPERIMVVQACDMAREVRGGLEHDCLHNRLEPGSGAFPVVELTRTLQRIGAATDLGLEVFSDEYDAMPALEAGRRGGESMRKLLATA